MEDELAIYKKMITNLEEINRKLNEINQKQERQIQMYRGLLRDIRRVCDADADADKIREAQKDCHIIDLDIGMSVRLLNILKSHEVRTLSEAAEFYNQRIKKGKKYYPRNFGAGSAEELRKVIEMFL